jgi:hypothetical protein
MNPHHIDHIGQPIFIFLKYDISLKSQKKNKTKQNKNKKTLKLEIGQGIQN